jgi:predicted AAA+ superfamily ATPase
LDDENFAQAADDDPGGFIRSLPLPVTLDEIQRVPELLRSIKVAVDRDRKPSAFILTGSANLLLLPRASESLAGRIEILHLYPLCEAEKERAPGAFLQTLLDGGLEPRILPAKDSDPLSLPRRLVIGGYPEALQRLFLVRLLPAWHRNRGKRLVKSPKIHLLDTGLAATLIDLAPEDWNARRAEFGRLLESFVVQQLIALASWTDSRLRFFHYRDRDQVEVDCVMTQGSKVWGFEVKAARTVRTADTKGLKRLAEQAGTDFQRGIVFYSGDSIIPLGDERFHAVPLSKLWEL